MNLSKQLRKLGAFSYQHPWRVIASWLVILGLLGFGASQAYTPPSSDISIPGTQAQQAIDRLDEIFPDSGGATGRIVFHAKNDEVSEYKSAVNSLVEKVSDVDGVARAVSPFVDSSFVSADKTIAYSQVQLDEQTGSVSEATLKSVEDLVTKARSEGLQVELGGDLVSVAPGEIIGTGELVGVAVALVVLVITLGSLIAGGMPILSAVTAVGVSMAGLFALSKVIDINSTTPVLAIMLGLAVGIDYSLFIVNKHRRLVIDGMPLKDAAARALGTAGNAVVFAAFTVIIALAALAVVQIPFMTTMGLAGAASIAVAAVVSLTFTPALMGLAGARILSKHKRASINSKKYRAKVLNRSSFWYKWAAAVTNKPVPVLFAAILVIATIALPAASISLGLPTDQYAETDSTERKAYDLLSEGFGAGFNAPLAVLVEDLPKVGAADEQAVRGPAMQAYEAEVAQATKEQQAAFQKQLQAAQTPEQQLAVQQGALEAQAAGEQQKKAALKEIEKQVDQYAKYVQLNAVAEQIKKIDNVELVQPALVTKDGTAGVVQVIPKTAPADAKTDELIAALRSDGVEQDVSGATNATLAVTGSAALQNDINQKLANALPLYVLVIVGLSLILLLVAFRSILVPIKATLGYVLSVLAMFGATVAVFQWGWFGIAEAAGPIVSFVPIIAAGILFGLAMDYEFFLVSGMHEAYEDTKDAKRSVVEGFAAGAKVVTAAAIIMISVFAGFITSHESVIQSVGFALAVGILIDAFLVRMTIVPAIMTLLGGSIWWLPKRLDKILPHVSIEGEKK
jgi:putative drug exporter of the RND superfamily